MASLWALESCDLGARDPHPPSNVTDTTLVSLTDPDSTIRQLEVGFESGVITSYMNAYADDFIFHPDPVDSSGAFSSPWDVNRERPTAQFIFSQFASREVAFADVDSFSNQPGVITFIKDYHLNTDGTEYEGQAELHLRQDSGEWRIIFWQDFRLQGSTLSTWGILRGENAPGAP